MVPKWILLVVLSVYCLFQSYFVVRFQLAESDMRKHRRNPPTSPDAENMQLNERWGRLYTTEVCTLTHTSLLTTITYSADSYVWISSLYQKSELSRAYEEYGLWLSCSFLVFICGYSIWISRELMAMLRESIDRTRRLLDIISELVDKNYELRKDLESLGLMPGDVKLLSM